MNEDRISSKWKHLRNKSMARHLSNGEARDVSPFRTDTGLYLLPDGFFEEGLDYCDATTESYIWSIGQEKTSAGRVFAALDGRFYQNSKFECLWLR